MAPAPQAPACTAGPRPPAQKPGAAERKLTPAQIRRSIREDVLISFEDGKPYKQLKRHLSSHGLTPHAYREKWGLPPDYPMTAPSYSAQRSALAKAAGLGKRTRRSSAKPRNGGR